MTECGGPSVIAAPPSAHTSVIKEDRREALFRRVLCAGHPEPGHAGGCAPVRGHT